MDRLCGGGKDSNMNEQMRSRIDGIFHLWTQGICPGGQVLIRKGGETVYERCFGYADIENRVPITSDTVFHVASVSKQFTVMGVMLLSRDGLVDLDSDIRTYIPEYVGFPDTVTVRDLMNNDSGIWDLFELQDLQGISNDDITTQRYALKMIPRQNALDFPPRSRYLYCNSNFVLLAAIAEKVSGKSLREFLDERIFRPLGMTKTVVRDRYWECIDGRAKSFLDNGTQFFYNPLVYGLYGATSLHTTARDLAKWMENYRNPTICPEDVIREMTTVTKLTGGAPTTYACGLWVGQLEGHRCFQHVGEDAGFRTIVYRLPDDDIDIIILSNTQNTFTEPSAQAIARIMLGLPEAKKPEMPVREAFDLAEAPGFYYAELPQSAIIRIEERDGTLYRMEKYGPAPLTRVRGNLFRMGHLETYLLLGAENPMLFTPEETICLRKAADEPLPEEQLQRYAGRYYCEKLETFYTVRACGGALYMEQMRRGQTLLHAAGEDRFVTEYPRSCFVQFVKDDAGEVSGLIFSGVRIARMPFKKMR